MPDLRHSSYCCERCGDCPFQSTRFGPYSEPHSGWATPYVLCFAHVSAWVRPSLFNLIHSLPTAYEWLAVPPIASHLLLMAACEAFKTRYLWLLLATSRVPSVTCKCKTQEYMMYKKAGISRDIHRTSVTHLVFNPFVSKYCPRPTSLVISAAVQDLGSVGSVTMKLTTIFSCMLYAASAVLAAPATIERRTSYSGGTTANDVVNKGLEHREMSCVGRPLTRM
jgi:hypothetical protein